MPGLTGDRVLRWGAGGFLLVFGFLPIVNWIPGGHAAANYLGRLAETGRDVVFAVGIGVVLAITARPMPGLWRPEPVARWIAAANHRPMRTALVVGLVGLAAYGTIAHLVFDGRPLLIDEIIQVWHARILAGGQLWTPVPEAPEFTRTMHIVDLDGRRFSQFPIGGPAMLALGALAGAEWLVGPVCGAVSIVLIWQLFRRVEPTGGVALGATLLFALAPFTAFMASTHMNHVTTLLWVLVAMLGLERATRDVASPVSAWLLTGLGFGLAATIRPFDAAVFALPAGLWLLRQAWRARRLGALVVAGAGVAGPIGLLLLANRATTGDPLVFGYQALWGSAHDLGFHTSPLGTSHTPLAGLELVNLYFTRLQLYLFEAPIPGLLPAAMALLLTSRLSGFDRYLLVTAALLVGGYWMYWHDGNFLGPRFMHPLLPVLTLWTARLLRAVRQHHGGFWYRVLVFTGLACVPLALVNVVVLRAREYHAGIRSGRMDGDRMAAERGIRGAVILVRESWGAEVMARLWARGIRAPDAEVLFRWVDTCLLAEAVAGLEQEGLSGTDALRRLRPLLADSARVMRSGLTTDPTLMALPGARYSARCLERIHDDRQGFGAYAPHLLAGDGGNVFVRDLRERNVRLGDLLVDRPAYLLRPVSPKPGAALSFQPLDVDSLRSGRRAGMR